MKTKQKLAAGAALLLVPSLTFAATTTWNGVSGDWLNGANWSAGLPGAGDVAALPVTDASTIGIDFSVSSTVAIGQISKPTGGSATTTIGAGSSASGVLSLAGLNGRLIDIGGGFVTIAKNVNGATGELTLALGTGDLYVGGANGALTINAVMTGTNGLTHSGPAISFTLGAQNTFTGGVINKSGALSLAFNTVGAPASDIINASNTLTIGNNSTLRIVGTTTSGAVSQTFAGTTLTRGVTSVSLSGTNGIALNLGEITRQNGATTAITLVTGGTVNTSSGAASTILTSNGTAYATVGQDWAAKDASNLAIVALSAVSGYTASTSTSLTGNADIAAGVTATTLTGDTAISSLRFGVAQVSTVNVGANTLGTGGILVTNTVGANLSTISGGSLRAANTGGELAVILNGSNAAANALVIASAIVDNGSASSLVKSGAGYLILSGANTYSGGTTLNAGSIQLNSANALGTGALTITAGTVVFGAAITATNAVTFANEYANGGSTVNTNGFNVVLTGNLSGTLNQPGFSKSGTGSLTLRGNNSGLTTGTLSVSAGTLIASSATALGSGGNLSLSGSSTLQIGETGFARSLTVSRNFNIGTGSTLDLATTTGGAVTLTLGAANTLSLTTATSVLKIGLGDQIVTNGGAVTLNGILNLNGEFDGVSGTQHYTLISLGGGSTATGNFVSIAGFDSAKVSTLFDTATGSLTVTAVPEPGTYGLLGAGSLLAALAIRRRRKNTSV